MTDTTVISRLIRRRALRGSQEQVVTFLETLEEMLIDSKVRFGEQHAGDPAMLAETTYARRVNEAATRTLPRWSLTMRNGDVVTASGQPKDFASDHDLSRAKRVEVNLGGSMYNPSVKVEINALWSAIEIQLRGETTKWLDRADAIVTSGLRPLTPWWSFLKSPAITTLFVVFALVNGAIQFWAPAELRGTVWAYAALLAYFVVFLVWVPLNWVPKVRIGGRGPVGVRVLAAVVWTGTTLAGAFLIYFVFKFLGLE